MEKPTPESRNRADSFNIVSDDPTNISIPELHAVLSGRVITPDDADYDEFEAS
jgi:hypothetical protein